MAIDKKHWQAALNVQSACNLSGVVISFAGVMRAICEEFNSLPVEEQTTEWKNKHPIAVLFVTQIYHLTGGDAGYLDAYEEAKEIVSE